MMGKIRWFCVAVILLFFADLLIISPAFLTLSAYTHDNLMGWMPKRDFERTFRQKDSAGNRYDAYFSLDHNRFRVYGNPATQRTKILFAGDSFTGDPYTGNPEMYFSVVKSALLQKYNRNVEIFAAGGGGYGTLQEYLLIKRQIRIIDPDVFVLQFCDNDFYNNLMEWEAHGIVRSQHFLRPYYSGDTGKVSYASTVPARLYRFLYTNSFIFRRIDGALQGLQYRYYGDYFKPMDPELKTRLEAQSFAVTKNLLSRMKQEFRGSTALFMVIDSTGGRHREELQVRLARESGFIPLFAPLHGVRAAEARGTVVRHADGGHLNIPGNKIFGEGVAQEISSYLQWQPAPAAGLASR